MPAKGTKLLYVQPGDPIRASQWNEIARQINVLSSYGDGDVVATGAGLFHAIKPSRLRDPDVVLVRNDVGIDLTQDHAVLGLHDLVIDPDDSEDVIHVWPPAFAGEQPDESNHVGKFAILDGPVGDGEFQTAVTSGIAHVNLYNAGDDHEWADLFDDSYLYMTSAVSGPGWILKREEVDVGDVGWAIVRLSNGAA